jgi:hypothetical protein
MISVLRETHDTPESVTRRLLLAGSTNRFGEANYRAVWGGNRQAWIGGKFEDRDERGALLRERIELRKEPKYPAANRWHIEPWVPLETYGSPRIVVFADNGTRWRAERSRTRSVSFARRLRTLLHAGKSAGRIYSTGGDYRGIRRTADRTVARRTTSAITHAALQKGSDEDQSYADWAYDLLDDAVPAFHKQPIVTAS